MHMQDSVKRIGYIVAELKDKNGKNKPLFQENAIGRLAKKLRGGAVPAIPLLFGMWVLGPIVIKNLVVSAGKAGLASRVNGSGGEAAFTYIAVGTGTSGPAAGDTTLGSEIVDSGLARVAASVSRQTTNVTNDTAQETTTFSVSGSKAVTEVGVLNAASTGTLLARQVFSAINVQNGDSLTITHKLVNA